MRRHDQVIVAGSVGLAQWAACGVFAAVVTTQTHASSDRRNRSSVDEVKVMVTEHNDHVQRKHRS
jgi:hypothetical protein